MADATKYSSKLSGAHVLVIGGSSGLGFSVAEACLESKANVTISSSKPERISAAIDRLLSSYPSAKSRLNGLVCDLSSFATIDENIKSLFEKVGKLDHIVCTAGDSLGLMKIPDMTVEKIHQAGLVRFVAPLLIGKHCRPSLASSPLSSITLTTGSVAEKPKPDWLVVGSYAAGLSGVTRGLALDLAPIRVNLISPGFVDTEMWDHIEREQYPAMKEAMAKHTTTGRVALGEDLAESYLCAMKDRNLSGSVITSNGGFMLVA